MPVAAVVDRAKSPAVSSMVKEDRREFSATTTAPGDILVEQRKVLCL